MEYCKDQKLWSYNVLNTNISTYFFLQTLVDIFSIFEHNFAILGLFVLGYSTVDSFLFYPLSEKPQKFNPFYKPF
jgi:hypothetical protein